MDGKLDGPFLIEIKKIPDNFMRWETFKQRECVGDNCLSLIRNYNSAM